jgi:hypothetical protein
MIRRLNDMKKALWFLGSFWLGVSGYAFNLDSLLVVSVGGPEALDSIKHLRSFRAEGSINLNGQQGRFIEYFTVPDKFYLEVRMPGVSLVQAYDGEVAWQKDHNGQVTQLTGFEKRELLKNLYFESFAYLLPDRLPGSMEYRGVVDRDGVPYHEVAFYPLDSDTVLAYFDRDSGRRKLLLSRLDNINTITLMDDYRRVSGILIPFYSRATAQGISLFSEFKLDTIEWNVPVDASLFAMSDVAAADYHFPPGEDMVKIPFQYRAGHIRLAATLNGRKRVWFILDSGSSTNVIHQPIARQLNLPVVGTLPARGLAGFENADLVRTDSIAIGWLTLYNQVAGSLDLAMLERAGNENEDFGGILGYDFLSRFPIMIDYQDTTLTVFNPDRFTPPEGGTEVPFHLTMLVPTIRCELNGVPGDFIVDLGNAFGLIVHQQFARRHKLEKKLDDVTAIPGRYSGIGGGVGGKTAFAATFRMGEVLLQSLRVILPDSSSGIAGSEQIAGNIGNLILENFKVLFDYKNSRLIFYATDT